MIEYIDSVENLNSLLIENTMDLVFILKTNFEIEYVNKKQCKQLLGYENEDLIGKKIKEIVEINYIDINNKRDNVENLEGIREFKFKKRNGSNKTFGIKIFEFYNRKKEKRLLLIANDRNINEEKSLAIAKLRKILQSSPHCFFYKDLEGKYLIANKETLNFFHVSNEDLIGKTELEFLSNKVLALKLIQQDNEIFETKIPKKIVIKKMNKEGIEEIYEVKKFPHFNYNKSFIGLLGMIENITEKNRISRELRESREKYKIITENVNDLICIINEKFKFDYINEKVYHRILGYKNSDLIGKDALKFFHPDDVRGVFSSIKDGIEKRKGKAEFRYKQKNGKYIWFEARGSIIDLDGEKKALLVSRVIEDRKKLEKQKDEFYADITHELRTPLTSIRGFTELLLKDDELSEDQKKDLKLILKSEIKLENLVNRILHYSRLKSGHLKLNRNEFRVSEIITRLTDELVLLIESKSIVINAQFEPDSKIVLDKFQISKVIKNLLMNAIKFSFSNGKIKIKSSINEDLWRFYVRDFGVGIPKSEIPGLFRRFHRIEHPDKPVVDGIGLGLTICRKVIDKYNGNIWLESDGENKGTQAIFEIDLNSIN
ncbi:MAG: PAS domain S-box protein [Candidatus Lokiarchaeota archaeon]|nr:PAS domain S-box protein [Candidatus Lokiarchaeota archaeon]